MYENMTLSKPKPPLPVMTPMTFRDRFLTKLDIVRGFVLQYAWAITVTIIIISLI